MKSNIYKNANEKISYNKIHMKTNISIFTCKINAFCIMRFAHYLNLGQSVYLL